MKQLFTCLLFFLSLVVSAQLDSSCEERLKLAMVSVANSHLHGRMVLFTKNYIEETMDFLQWLISSEDCYANNNSLDVVAGKTGASVILMKRSRRADEESNKVSINYYTGKDDKINSVIISGKWSDMVDIYLDYWNANIKLNFKNKEVSYFTGMNDRVALSIVSKNSGKITIINNLGNDILNQYRCK